MVRLVASLAITAVLLSGAPSWAAKPADVSAISRLSKVYTKGVQDPSKAWLAEATEAGLKHRLKRLKSLAKTHGYSDLLLIDPDDLEKKLEGAVRRQAKKVRETESIRKRSELVHELLVLSTEDSAIEAVLAEYLGFPSVGDLLAVKLERAKIDFSKYVSVSSETERLKIIKKSTALGAERGGTGAGNGIPDAGEWIQVSMAVKNVSEKPYFSSSAWVTTSSECAWAPKAQEFEFPELAPGGDDVGALNVWVYLSRTCPDGESVTLRVNVKDTHRTRGEGHILSVRIPVHNRLRHKATELRFDRDVPGFSDGSKAKITDAGQSFELSHGMRYTSSRFRKAYMGWAVDRDGDSLIEEQSFRAEAPLLKGGGDNDKRLLPGDDLDILTAERKKFEREIKDIARAKGWATASDAHIIFATDVVLAYADPQPPLKPKAKPKTESSCTDGEDNDDDGDIDCDDSECKGKKVCKVLKPVDVSEVMSLVRATTRIEAQRTSKTGADAIDAVNDHYELNFDSDRFAKNYRCLVNEVPLEKCGEKKCPECKKEKKSESSLKSIFSSKPPETRYVQYVKRTYFRVPVKWTPPDACTNVVCETPAAPRCSGTTLITEKSPGRCVNGGCVYSKKSVDCSRSGKQCQSGRCVKVAKAEPPPPPEPEVPEEPLPDMGARLDVGYLTASISVPEVNISGKLLWDTDSASASAFQLRYSHGMPGLTYYGGLAFGSGEIASIGDSTALSTFSLSGGAGYLMRLNNRLEFHPRAGLALLYRGLEVDETPWTDDGTLTEASMDVGAMAVGLEVGASLRARFTAGLAAYVDFAYILQGASPAWTTPSGDELTLLSGNHPRVGAGLTWMW